MLENLSRQPRQRGRFRPFRSLLFVPGNREGWAEKAVRAGADAVILDLEDAVPEHQKESARTTVAASIDWLHAEHPEVGVLVRPNGLLTPHVGKDLAAVVRPGLDALLLPMIRTPEDVIRYDALVTYFESERNLDPGSISLVPTLETAQSVAHCEQIAQATPRVASLLAAAAKGADIAREIGFVWTPEGLETLYLRSRAIVACRAAGITHPICGVWQDIHDLDGLAAFAQQNRRLGFRGQALLHPSHVEITNRTYGISDEELDRYERMVATFEAAEGRDRGAVLFEGEHIDIAHVETARQILKQAGRR
jgi:citrate lyase subunit beta/citryl-CoA lyase